MGPETIVYPTPATEAAARTAFDGANSKFAGEFARGHGWFSDIADRVRGLPTSREKIDPLARGLRDTKAFLAEIIGRRQTPGMATDLVFRDNLSTGISIAHVGLGSEVINSSQEATHTTDPLGNIYRGYLQSDGARALGGAVLYAAANGLGWITGENATLATEASVILAGTGVIDLARRGFVDWTTRHLRGLPSTIAEVLRRKASVAEGEITGDYIDYIPPANTLLTLSNAQQAHLECDIRAQLETNGIVRPAVVPIGNTTWAPGLRETIRPALGRADETEELIRAREAAKFSRLIRTVLATMLLAGVSYAHLTREPVCGVTGFPDASDESVARFGQPDRVSMWGKAEEYAFRARYGHSFNRDSAWDQEHIALDRVEPGYGDRITSMSQDLRSINPQLSWVDGDRFLARGTFNEPCFPGQQRSFNRLHPRIVPQEGGGIRIIFGQ